MSANRKLSRTARRLVAVIVLSAVAVVALAVTYPIVAGATGAHLSGY